MAVKVFLPMPWSGRSSSWKWSTFNGLRSSWSIYPIISSLPVIAASRRITAFLLIPCSSVSLPISLMIPSMHLWLPKSDVWLFEMSFLQILSASILCRSLLIQSSITRMPSTSPQIPSFLPLIKTAAVVPMQHLICPKTRKSIFTLAIKSMSRLIALPGFQSLPSLRPPMWLIPLRLCLFYTRRMQFFLFTAGISSQIRDMTPRLYTILSVMFLLWHHLFLWIPAIPRKPCFPTAAYYARLALWWTKLAPLRIAAVYGKGFIVHCVAARIRTAPARILIFQKRRSAAVSNGSLCQATFAFR